MEGFIRLGIFLAAMAGLAWFALWVLKDGDEEE